MRVRPPSLPPFQVHDEPATPPTAHVRHQPKTWQAALITIVLSSVSGMVGFISSHWGGLTRAEMDTVREDDKKDILKQLDAVKTSCVRESDNLHTYVDEQIQDRIERLGLVPKKRKPVRREPRERDE